MREKLLTKQFFYGNIQNVKIERFKEGEIVEMKKLSLNGKEVYTSDEVVDLCEITKSMLYQYASGNSNLLIRDEDFITLKSLSEKEGFLKENPSYIGNLRTMISLYYESAINKIIDYREHLANSPYKKRANINKKEVASSQSKELVIPVSKEVNQGVSEQDIHKEILPIFDNYQLEILSRLVIRLDEENKSLNKRVIQLESELKEVRNSNLELANLLQEYISLKKR